MFGSDRAAILIAGLLSSIGGAASAEPMTGTASTATVATQVAPAPIVEPAPLQPEPPAARIGRPASVIEAIEVVGNEKTSTQVILRRVVVGIGDRVDDERVEESRLRLLSTGYFKWVELSVRRGSKRGLVLLVVEVEERNTLVIDALYLGHSSVAPIFGGLGINESNFLGEGVSAGAAFVVGRDRHAIDFRVFVPDLSGTPLQLAASGIWMEGAETLVDSDPDALQLTYSRIGGTIGIGLGVGGAQRVLLDYRLETINADPLPNLDPAALRSAPSIQFDASILSTLSLTYELDTRDDAFVPSSGARVVLAVETGTRLIGSSYEFSKYTAQAQIAFMPFDAHSLSLHAFAGLVQGTTPFFNQFFGSDHAYFAFGRDSLPRGIGVNFSESNDYDDIIGSAGIDYSVPLQRGGGFLFRTYVYGGLDVSVTASLDERQEDPSGRGTGGYVPLSFDIGLRLDTLIGNFTVSVAYVLDLVL